VFTLINHKTVSDAGSARIVDLIGNTSTIVNNENGTTTFSCEAIGYPTLTVVWRTSNGNFSDRVSVSDSISVPTENRNIIRVRVNLTISNAAREDTGVYICHASNVLGSDSRNVTVTVQCT